MLYIIIIDTVLLILEHKYLFSDYSTWNHVWQMDYLVVCSKKWTRFKHIRSKFSNSKVFTLVLNRIRRILKFNRYLIWFFSLWKYFFEVFNEIIFLLSKWTRTPNKISMKTAVNWIEFGISIGDEYASLLSPHHMLSMTQLKT